MRCRAKPNGDSRLVQKADLQPDRNVDPNQSVVDETVIRVNDQRHWLHATVDPDTNQFLCLRLFQTRTTQLTLPFVRELREKQQVSDVTFLVDDAHHLENAWEQLRLRFRVYRRGN